MANALSRAGGWSKDGAALPSRTTGSGKIAWASHIKSVPDNTPPTRIERMELANSSFKIPSSGTMIATTNTRKTAGPPFPDVCKAKHRK
ncbi:hypothetical protein D3C80_1967910 [compost metagenome]